MPKLEPCPGCARDECMVIGGPGTAAGPHYWAGCRVCRWRTIGDTEEEAIALWNKRACLDHALVIIESPFAGDVEANERYARSAMRDALLRGEHPIASHLLYTQPGILDDNVAEERRRGIEAGLAWRKAAARAVFYIGRGWSPGMEAARAVYEAEGFPYEVRNLVA